MTDLRFPAPTLRQIRWAFQDTATITWRDMVRTARQPEMLAFAVIMGMFFLLLFNYVFGGAIGGRHRGRLHPVPGPRSVCDHRPAGCPADQYRACPGSFGRGDQPVPLAADESGSGDRRPDRGRRRSAT